MVLIVIAMFGFGYALVPLYDVICDVTGLNGKTGRVGVEEATGPDLDREITVKFTGSLGAGTPFEFRPSESSLVVHPGQPYTTNYVAKNLTGRQITAQAIPSVSPSVASLYFNKTECFCFSQQMFEPKESKDMPVQFIIDRDIPKHVKSVVLSYTFFELKDNAGSEPD
ncbi:cytochrome c oxidase assembly protein CtaG/Cox11 [gamma proteobacterium HTCC5015]|nr:cytochrome c oxidase assembly protein CtaG/Cox11 [gamma proteobacterium HTCC5015]